MKVEVKLIFEVPAELDNKPNSVALFICNILQYAEMEMRCNMKHAKLAPQNSYEKLLETQLKSFQGAMETITIEKIDG